MGVFALLFWAVLALAFGIAATVFSRWYRVRPIR